MLKLIKYELIGSYRQYLLTFLVFILGCIILPFLPTGIGKTISAFFMIAVFGIVISIFVNIILSYNNSMFKRPGYLTLTLPVTSSQLLISKVIGALIWSVIACVVLVMGIGILMFVVSEASISDFINGIGPFINQVVPYLGDILGKMVFMLIEFLVTILSFYFTITLINTRFIPKYKICIGIFGYFMVVVLLGYFISTPLIADFMISLSSSEASALNTVVSIIMIIGFFFGTNYLLERQIEVE